MKWMITGLLGALVLIGLGFVLTNGNGGDQVSHSPEAERLCEEGTRDLNAFRWPSAIEKLGECLELDPTLAEASIARAFAYIRLGERQEFKVEAGRADSLTADIKDDQRRMVAQLRLSGIGSSQFHDMRDSLLTRLKTEAPNNIHVLEALAGNASKSGDLDQVEQAWLNILAVDPNYASSYNNLGYLELNRGNYDQAIEYMQKYAFLAPDLANPHDSLGEVLMVLGRYEEAESEFKTSIKMQPDFYHSLINLGKTYIARGQIKTGINILNKVHTQVESSEIQMRVDHEIVSTYLVAGLEKELGKMATIYIERYPKDENTPIYRGIILASTGHVKEGRAVIDSSLATWRKGESYESYPEAKKGVDGAAHQFAGLLADVEGKYDVAAENWHQSVELMKGSKSYHEQWYPRYRWALSLFQAGRPQESIEVLDPILQINPRLINMLVLKVECHLALEQGDQAQQAFEQLEWSLAKADPDVPARLRAEELGLLVSALASGG